jgi:hypothetical protein
MPTRTVRLGSILLQRSSLLHVVPGTDGGCAWSCTAVGVVATATVGRVDGFEAIIEHGRGRLVRFLAACCRWRS